MKPLKYLLALWVLAASVSTSAAQTDHIIWWFGDSLCSNKPHAAPWWIHQQDHALVHNNCQPGMAASQFTMPNWIFPDFIAGADVHVVLWFGTNDARTGNYEDLDDKYHEILQTLAMGAPNAASIDTLVILPPVSTSQTYYQDLLNVRGIIEFVASQYENVTVLDLEYDWSMTTGDGLHPTQQHAKTLGSQVLDALGISH